MYSSAFLGRSSVEESFFPKTCCIWKDMVSRRTCRSRKKRAACTHTADHKLLVLDCFHPTLRCSYKCTAVPSHIISGVNSASRTYGPTQRLSTSSRSGISLLTLPFCPAVARRFPCGCHLLDHHVAFAMLARRYLKQSLHRDGPQLLAVQVLIVSDPLSFRSSTRSTK